MSSEKFTPRAKALPRDSSRPHNMLDWRWEHASFGELKATDGGPLKSRLECGNTWWDHEIGVEMRCALRVPHNWPCRGIQCG